LTDDAETVTPGAGADPSADQAPARPTTSLVKILIRIGVTVGALALSFFVLARAFDDLDPQAIADALRSLQDAEILALASLWVIWLACQGLQTASLVPGLPVRRGVIAFAGPAAVASIIPGPSDLPVRHRMLRSWGYDSTTATVAVAAGGIFSIGIKLLLPVVAAIGLIVSDSPVDGTLRTAVTIALVVGLGVMVVAVVLSSPTRTARVARLIEPIWRWVLRLLRKDAGGGLEQQLLDRRASSVEALRGRWIVATWGTVLTAVTRFGLLVMAVRFMGLDEAIISWPQIFVVYAVVQGLTVIPISAGDAGISELAYISMLTAIAGPEYVNEVTAAVLVFRVMTWLAMIPTGMMALGLWRLALRSSGTTIAELDTLVDLDDPDAPES
jgi:hypothetical protein